MKCENVFLGRKCKIKKRGFKHTTLDLSRNMLHLLDCDELVVVDRCTTNEMVLVKESLQQYAFYIIDRRDLKNLSK